MPGYLSRVGYLQQGVPHGWGTYSRVYLTGGIYQGVPHGGIYQGVPHGGVYTRMGENTRYSLGCLRFILVFQLVLHFLARMLLSLGVYRRVEDSSERESRVLS